MRSFELGWETRDNVRIYASAWEPDGTPKAVVCLVHGLGEHIGRYEHVGERLAGAGYALLGADIRGHGRSGGPRGHTPSYEALLDDIAKLLSEAALRYPGLPLFLYGHSLGGGEALNYVIRRKPSLAGVIAAAPHLRLAFRPPAYKLILGRAARPILPGLPFKSGLEAAALSRDRDAVEAYRHDPLVHDQVTPGLYFGFRDAGEWALEHAAGFPLPLLLMHGGQDRLNSLDATREFAQRGGSRVTLQIWQDCYHELHNDLQKEEVFKAMVAWMDARLAR